MERNRKENRVLDTVAELFDLPGDVVAGQPHLEMMGHHQLFLERHSGILSYQQDCIDINTPGGVLRITGQKLTLLAMTAEEVRVGGEIHALEWVNQGC